MENAVAQTKPARLVSLDAYRGFIMLAMASGGFYIAGVMRHEPYHSDPFWQFLAYHLDHVEWTGGGFWDMIQPSFMFMVGVAIPYSYAARVAKGESEAKIWMHTVLRALLLVGLGVFLASSDSSRKSVNFLFTNVLAQIGLGYCFVYMLRDLGWRVQLCATAFILVGYWLFFFLYPLPSSDFDVASVGITEGWAEKHWLTGIFAHWNKNVNAAAGFDVQFLNLFPREQYFEFERGGYQTLNFVPSMATMILGLMAGELLRGPRTDKEKFVRLVLAGLGCLALGCTLDQTICPSVKRIWTPSWAVYSSGWTFLMLAGFYGVIDLLGYQRWAFPLVIVGMNSIAVYMMAQLMKGWVGDMTKKFFGPNIFQGTYFEHELFNPVFARSAQSAAFLVFLLLASWWMYRQKIFVKI